MAVINEKREKSNIINRLFREEKWEEARKFIFDLMKDNPDDHFLLTRLATTYYEERQYSTALKYVEQAIKIAPRCPLVLFELAGTLDMLERDEDAIDIYRKLIRTGVNRIAYGECGEGIRDARTLVNDCRYRLGLVYASIGEFRLANKYIREHIANRGRNYASEYSLRLARKRLAIVLAGEDPRKKR